MHDPYPEQGETLLRGCSGIWTYVVWVRKTGQRREKMCSKIQGSKGGRNVGREKPSALHVGDEGGFCGKLKAWHSCELSWKMDAGVENSECRRLEIGSAPTWWLLGCPGWHWSFAACCQSSSGNIGISRRCVVGHGLHRRALCPQFSGEGKRRAVITASEAGKGQNWKGWGLCESWDWGLSPLVEQVGYFPALMW